MAGNRWSDGGDCLGTKSDAGALSALQDDKEARDRLIGFEPDRRLLLFDENEIRARQGLDITGGMGEAAGRQPDEIGFCRGLDAQRQEAARLRETAAMPWRSGARSPK